MRQIIIKSSRDVYINSNLPNKNYGNIICKELWVGNQNNASVFHTLLYFDIDQSIKALNIMSGTLKLFVDYVPSKSIPAKITPYLITEPWEESKVTWSNQPSISPIKGETVIVTERDLYKWDITSIVDSWYNNEKANYGILLKSDSSLICNFKRILSTSTYDGSTLASKPTLTIHYEEKSKSQNKTVLVGRKFFEEKTRETTKNQYFYSTPNNTSEKTLVTYFVKNKGANPAKVKLQIGPNTEDFIDDSPEFIVAPLSIIPLVPKIYGKYTRVAYKSDILDQPTDLLITFQSCI